MTDIKKRVLILGGGFGGVYVAVHLGKLLSKKEHGEIEIVMVNRENTLRDGTYSAKPRLFRIFRAKRPYAPRHQWMQSLFHATLSGNCSGTCQD